MKGVRQRGDGHDGEGGAGAPAPGRALRSARRYSELATEAGPPATIDEIATAAVNHKDAGRPVDPSVHGPVGAHLGVDLSGARVHDEPLARAASQAIGARAFAHGNDVFLGPGESDRDPRLMAHELTHVAQQSAARAHAPQRQVAVGPADSPAEHQAEQVAAAVAAGARPAWLLVDEDAAHVTPVQMTKQGFIDALRPAVTAAADEELGPAMSAVGCPIIERYFREYGRRPARDGEALLRRFTPGVTQVRAARDMIPIVVERVRLGVRQWTATGGVPPELADQAPDAVPRPPAVVMGQAQRLDDATASRFGEVMGDDFADVRIHTGEQAARFAAEHDARAVTVGRDVAFAAGAYTPGTVAGDALLAHELAHVQQQRGADDAPAAELAEGGDAYEADADRTATGVLGRLYQGARGAVRAASDRVRSTLSSSLRLSRCPGSTQPQQASQPAAPQPDQAPALPAPFVMQTVGDRFRVSFRRDADTIVTSFDYQGPYTADPGHAEVDMSLEGRDVSRPLASRVSHVDETSATIDLFGDGTALLRVRDDARLDSLQFGRRVHMLHARLYDDMESSTPGISVVLPASANSAPAAASPDEVRRDTTIATAALAFEGDRFVAHVRRFGTSNQAQLAIASAGAIPGPGLLFALSGPPPPTGTLPPLLSARIVHDDGRDIQIDCNTDGAADVHIVHTVDAVVRAGMQHRTHYFRAFAADGMFLGEVARIEQAGPPVAIPPSQDERTRAPNTSPEWPTTRPPEQDDVPGEWSFSHAQQGGIVEMRVDADGDRTKELLLRFQVQGSDGAHILRVQGVQLSSGTVQQVTMPMPDVRDFFPVMNDAADGRRPLAIRLANDASSPVLTIDPPQDAAGQRVFTLHLGGAAGTFTFPAEAAMRALASETTAPTQLGGVRSFDTVLGEYHDYFRVTLEPRQGQAVLAISTLGADGPVTARATHLANPAQASGLAVVAGDPRTLSIDVNGDGVADVQVFDRMARAVGPGGVGQQRMHDLLLTGAQIAAQESWSFLIRDGVPAGGTVGTPQDMEGVGAALAVDTIRQQSTHEGNYAAYIQRVDAMLADSRRRAVENHVLSQATFDAWYALRTEMIQLGPQFAQDHVSAELIASAADHAQALHDALAAETRGHDTSGPEGAYTRTTNPYTGESTRSAGTLPDPPGPRFSPGAITQLPRALRDRQWTTAQSLYTTAVEGLDRWIADNTQTVRPGSPEAQQQRYLFETAQQMHAIAGRQNLTRVFGAFLPDQSYPDAHQYRNIPLNLFAYKEGNTWHLLDITNPQRTFNEHLDVPGDDARTLPPRELFEMLDYKNHFPRGVIRYQIPGGDGGDVVTTESESWSSYLSYISMALAGIGLVASAIATFGTSAVAATVAAVAFAGAGVAGAAAGVADLIERARHGALDPIAVVIDLGQIVAGVGGAGAALSGRVVMAARAASLTPGAEAWSGAWANFARMADKIYVPFVATAATGDAMTFAGMTANTIRQIQELGDGPGSTQAKIALASHLMIMGGITFMSLRGSMPEIMGRNGPNIIIDDVGGVPVARAGNVQLGGRNIELSGASADTHAAARWAAQSGEATAARGTTNPAGFDDYYRQWLAQRRRIEFDAHGQPRPVFDQPPPSPEIEARIRQLLADPSSELARTEQALARADEARAVEQGVQDAADGRVLRPGTPEWQANRERIVAALTGRMGGRPQAEAAVERYAQARMGVATTDPMAFLAERRQLRSMLPDEQLGRIRALYPGNEVYVTGAAVTPGSRITGATPIDVVVVVPRDTLPELMHAMEQRVNGLGLLLDPAFADANQLERNTRPPIRARVVTDEQFFGLATADQRAAGAVHRIDTPMTPELNQLEGLRARVPDDALRTLTGTGLRAAEITTLVDALDRDLLARLAVGLSRDQAQHLLALASLDGATARRLARLLGRGMFDHTLEVAGSQLVINRQLTIAPSRLAEISDPDLQTILEATRQMGTDAAAARARLSPFAASGSYRLRFSFQLQENETWFTQVLDRAGLRSDPRAQTILSGLDDAGRIRLNEPRTEPLPAGVSNIADTTHESIQVKATRYALAQNPPNAREFVNHYEMYTSEYMRQRQVLRERIEARTAELIRGGQAQAAAEAQASTEILGRPVQGFRDQFNRAVSDRMRDGDVTTRAGALTTQLAGRAGAQALGAGIDMGNVATRVQARSNHQFGSTSSATYHANKHWRELPRAHQATTFAPDQVSQYLASANETITGGAATVQRNQDGTINVSVTRDYGGGVRMRAILRVDADGNAMIATYGSAN